MPGTLSRKNIIVSAIFTLISLPFIDCAISEEKPKPPPEGKVYKMSYPKIKNYEVNLKCMTFDRAFEPGKPAKLTFGLRNEGGSSVMIYEWMMKESDDLRLYYVPFKEGMKTPARNSKEWLAELPEIKGNPRRMPLELAPKNTVLIEKELNFTASVAPGTKEPKYFLVYAELNLESISAFSEPVKIVVEPRAQ